MSRVPWFVLAAVLALPATAAAQERPSLLGAPAFVLQPGVVKPLARGADAAFNARMLTVIPTAVPRTALLLIVEWTPFRSIDGPEGHGSYRLNSPAFIYGANVMLFQSDLVTVMGDGLFAYTPSASNPTTADYTHKFLFSGDVFINVGRWLGDDALLRNLSVYGFVARVLTGVDDPPPPAPRLTARDRMLVLAGLSLPVAPW